MTATTLGATGVVPALKTRRRSAYPGWFFLPAAIIYSVLFLAPTFASLYFSLTRWTLFDATFIGLDNFAQFFREPFLIQGLVNTIVYAVVTSGLKVILGMALAVIFFPVLVSTVGVGITFTVLMHPTAGAINETLAMIGIKGPGWLVDPRLALYSVALVDVWKGVGLATVIYIAGLVAIPRDYYEAARIDGATKWQNFIYVTLPLSRPATATVITLSFIGGLRTFDLIWAMTKGGPGFASDTVASVIYKQYQASCSSC
jgi:raffinose/stachyose/melibiose transport system permease protein